MLKRVEAENYIQTKLKWRNRIMFQPYIVV